MNDAAVNDAFVHPCQRCGACCAAFRVAFHWSELPPALAATMSAPLRQHELAMRGTDDALAPRCIALHGEIGRRTECSIYAQRPSPCRQVRPSLEDGSSRDAHCDRARQRHGLPPLNAADWAVP